MKNDRPLFLVCVFVIGMLYTLPGTARAVVLPAEACRLLSSQYLQTISGAPERHCEQGNEYGGKNREKLFVRFYKFLNLANAREYRAFEFLMIVTAFVWFMYVFLRFLPSNKHDASDL